MLAAKRNRSGAHGGPPVLGWGDGEHPRAQRSARPVGSGGNHPGGASPLALRVADTMRFFRPSMRGACNTPPMNFFAIPWLQPCAVSHNTARRTTGLPLAVLHRVCSGTGTRTSNPGSTNDPPRGSGSAHRLPNSSLANVFMFRRIPFFMITSPEFTSVRYTSRSY